MHQMGVRPQQQLPPQIVEAQRRYPDIMGDQQLARKLFLRVQLAVAEGAADTWDLADREAQKIRTERDARNRRRLPTAAPAGAPHRPQASPLSMASALEHFMNFRPESQPKSQEAASGHAAVIYSGRRS